MYSNRKALLTDLKGLTKAMLTSEYQSSQPRVLWNECVAVQADLVHKDCAYVLLLTGNLPARAMPVTFRVASHSAAIF